MGKRALIGKAGLNGDISEGHPALQDELTRSMQALALNVLPG
jgi:hypothetical protein